MFSMNRRILHDASRDKKWKRRYQLIVRLKAIEYKENFLYYLFFTISFYFYGSKT